MSMMLSTITTGDSATYRDLAPTITLIQEHFGATESVAQGF